MKYKMLQPVSGWTAVFYVDDELLTLPVPFFAVVEDIEEQPIGASNLAHFIPSERTVPLVVNHFGYRASRLVEASTMRGFIGLATPGEAIDQRWEKEARGR